LTLHPTPTPTDLRLDPELAILAALDHALELAVYALVAIHPELTDSEGPFWRREDSAIGHAANHIVDRSETLKQAIFEYQTAILNAREEEANDALPF
jgi:hypothetical protein